MAEKISYGFMKLEKYDVLVIDSKKMEAVKLMYSLCLDGMSLGRSRALKSPKESDIWPNIKKDEAIG